MSTPRSADYYPPLARDEEGTILSYIHHPTAPPAGEEIDTPLTVAMPDINEES